ncbi:transposase [Pedobacter psychrophilus]|uniref:Transposase n=1 Tax=Pedobacter psychrophilus TaxID=1826909 RepID=A0A179DH40_9SPHI|nr:transposase [Pedobacter psychrophilus]OAQ40396.1 transposase [Pedobacter psychrophilus]
MSEGGYLIHNQHSIHFITFAVVQWVDVFTRKIYSDIIIDSLKFCQENKGLKIHAWCLMSNHIHLIISTDEKNKLSDVLRDFKKFTSVKIIKEIENSTTESRKNWMIWIFKKAGEANNRNKEYQFWQQDNHPIELDSEEIFNSKINYLHYNPVKVGLVKEEKDYLLSSGIDYFGDEEGLLKIDFV